MRLHWAFEPAASFYRSTLSMQPLLLPLDREGFEAPADLYYAFAHQQDALAPFGACPLAWWPVSSTVLSERPR
jgi:hypothetical protein